MMSYTDEEMMRLQLAACAMAGLLRRREEEGGVSYHLYDPGVDHDRLRLSQHSLAVADALMAEAARTPRPAGQDVDVADATDETPRGGGRQ